LTALLDEARARPTFTQDALALLWRRRWVALTTFVAVIAGVAIMTATLPKTYETTAYVLVNPSRPASTNFEQTQISQALLTTYAELLKSQNLADEVKRRLGAAQVGNPVKKIGVEPVAESQLLKITGAGSSPRAAQTLTNVYTQVFQERTRELAQADASAGRASVAEPATLPTQPVRPRPKLYLLAGALLAALAAFGAALLAQRLDQRLDITDGMTEILGLPVIGRIPQGSSGDDLVLVGGRPGDRESRAAAEAFRLLLANLSFANMGTRPTTVAVVSSDEQEGKSTCALSLARAAGELEIHTLLVEADLRRPSLTEKAGPGWIPSPVGLSSLLVRRALLSEAASPLPESRVDLLPAGPLPPNPAALLGSEALRDFDTEARERYELVVYDTPPLSVAADASLISAHAEGVVLVVDARRTNRKLATQAVAQLHRAQANVLGVVVNRVDSSAYVSGYYAADPALIVDQSRDPEPVASETPRSRRRTPDPVASERPRSRRR
jgi:capsular exopolysaccharide synthesis family protein